MDEPEPIELDVHLTVAEEEMHGEVSGPGLGAIPFSGWLGLLGAVERACERPDPAAGEQCDEPPRGGKGRP